MKQSNGQVNDLEDSSDYLNINDRLATNIQFEQVHFMVATQETVELGENFILNIYAYLNEQIQDFQIDGPEDSLNWYKEMKRPS